ncbi:MAG TPA: response regulator [Vicinamibacterales bacterium]
MPLVYIVEDHGDTRDGYAEYLTGCGFTVRSVGSAAEFWAGVKSEPPQAIVMDLRLPQVDGWKLTREVRDDARTAGTPVIVVSASVREEDRAKAFDSGANAFLPKPCNLDDIVANLRRLLAMRDE